MCSSPIIIQVINLRRLIWTRHAAGIGVELGAYRVLAGYLERDHLEDQGRDWRTVLKLTLQNMMGEEPELD